MEQSHPHHIKEPHPVVSNICFYPVYPHGPYPILNRGLSSGGASFVHEQRENMLNMDEHGWLLRKDKIIDDSGETL